MAETPSEKLTGSIFDRIKDFFTAMWEGVWSVEPHTASPLMQVLFSVLESNFEKGAIDYFKSNLTKTMEDMNFPDSFKTVINKLTADNSKGSYIGAYFLVYYYYYQYIGQHANVVSQLSTHFWNKEYKPTLPDPMSLILGLFRDPSDEVRIKDELAKHGYNDERIDTLIKTSKSIPSPDEYKNLFLRGEITETELYEGYRKYGFTDTEITHLKTLFYPIPNYPDLVRMAVREAFYPDYVQEYGLLNELPGQFLEYAGKQGLSEEWAKHFWASHWELPSILQGFEMLHRDVITSEQLDKLFMAVDIMPWWRDKLEAISYNPLTRVDIRRVFKMGIVTRDEVKRTYLDLGYNEEKAEWLTVFTEMQNTEADKDLTKAEVLSAYDKAIINQTTCNEMLLDLGYSQDEVNILISVKEYQTLKEIKSRELKRIQKYYLAGAFTANQTITELGKLDLVGAEQDSIMQLWDSEKLAKLKMPSKKELDTFYSNNIISEPQYRAELDKMGYKGVYVEWYVTLIKQAMQETT